jgi:hypothetical protein
LVEAALSPASIRASRLWATFGDADHGGPQQPVVQHITRLQDLDYSAARLVRPISLEDRLVEVVVEGLTLRVETLDSVSFEGRKELALCRRDTFQQAAGPLVSDLCHG